MQRRKVASLRPSDVRQHQKGKRDQPSKFIIKKGGKNKNDSGESKGELDQYHLQKKKIKAVIMSPKQNPLKHFILETIKKVLTYNRQVNETETEFVLERDYSQQLSRPISIFAEKSRTNLQ